jgi:hypothetical protein
MRGVLVIAMLAPMLAPALARAEPDEQAHAAADAIVVAPFGDWMHEAGAGGGAAVRVDVPTGAYTTITARVGAIAHAPVDDAGMRVGLVELPLGGGARYYVTEPRRVRAFLAGDVGVVVRRTSVSAAGATDVEWKIVFGSSLGAGVVVDRWELGAAIWLPDLAHVEHAAAAMITAGATFASW